MAIQRRQIELGGAMYGMVTRQTKMIVAALLWILVLDAACGLRREEQKPVVRTSGSEPLTAKQAYPIAKAWAEKWHSDSYLENVTMVIPGNEIDTGARKITYVFISVRTLGPLRWWDSASIDIDSYTGEITGVETGFEGYDHEDPVALHLEGASLDSSDALRIAEASGGKDYRKKHPGAHVRIEGRRWLRPLSWYVLYSCLLH